MPAMGRLNAIAQQIGAAAKPHGVARLPSEPLSEDELRSFFNEGYLVVPGVMTGDHTAALNADFEKMWAEAPLTQRAMLGSGQGFRALMGDWLLHGTDFATLGSLPSFPPIVERVRQHRDIFEDGGSDGVNVRAHQPASDKLWLTPKPPPWDLKLLPHR